LTGVRPKSWRIRGLFVIRLPGTLVKAFEAVPGFGEPGRRLTSARTLPHVVYDTATPTVLVREFLAALFGGDGVAPTIAHFTRDPNTMKSVRFLQSRTNEAVVGRMLDEVRAALARLGVASEKARLVRVEEAICPQWRGLLEITDGLAFAERVGFR